MYWATELALAGYGAYGWRRLRIIASEDVGLAEPMMPVLIRSLCESWSEQKKADKGSERHANLFLIHAVLALSRAPKSRLVDHAYVVVMADRSPLEVPDCANDVHTARGREMGRGAEHFYTEGAVVEPVADVPTRTWSGRSRSTSRPSSVAGVGAPRAASRRSLDRRHTRPSGSNFRTTSSGTPDGIAA